ncbi:MAG TPA: hypothetical protein VGP24_10160, partial [Glaciihabitans sp.]|nr:hypothetical protein [Glaciihabitans sp.]
GPFALQFERPSWFADWYQDFRYTGPLVLGIIGMVLLAFPIRARSGRGSAELTRRTPLSFAKGLWIATPVVVVALILVVTVTAGAASRPDPESGHYTMYFVDLGGERGMGTNIYGWFNSIPCLILIGVMISIAIINLFLIARPALDQDHFRDAAVRTVRTRNVLMVGTGALLMHLGLIFGSLAGTASIRSSFATSEGPVAFWTTFAALGPWLSAASSVSAALGFALWTTVALSAIPSKRLAPTSVSS